MKQYIGIMTDAAIDPRPERVRHSVGVAGNSSSRLVETDPVHNFTSNGGAFTIPRRFFIVHVRMFDRKPSSKADAPACPVLFLERSSSLRSGTLGSLSAIVLAAALWYCCAAVTTS